MAALRIALELGMTSVRELSDRMSFDELEEVLALREIDHKDAEWARAKQRGGA